MEEIDDQYLMRRRTETSELTVRSKVDRAIRDMAALVVADPDWQIVAVDERDCGWGIHGVSARYATTTSQPHAPS